MPIDSLVDRLLERWRDEGVAPEGPASAALIRIAEQRLGVALPASLARYLSHVNGMAAGAYDRHDIRFWNVEELELATGQGYGGENLSAVVFADYSAWTHAYGMILGNVDDGMIVVVGAVQVVRVAPTFADFIETYLGDTSKLFPIV